MKPSLSLLLFAFAACTSTSSDSKPAVACTSVAASNGPSTGDCTLDYGVCSDGKTYELICREEDLGGVDDNGLDCLCEIDGVIALADEIGISYTTCAMAAFIPPSSLEEAWTACGFDITLGS